MNVQTFSHCRCRNCTCPTHLAYLYGPGQYGSVTIICMFRMLFSGKSCASCALQTHADYEHRLQEEVNARLLKEQELQQLVTQLPNFTA